MIPITRPEVGEEEAEAAADAVRSGWLSQGPRVQEFEGLVAAYVGAPHAVATSNCTTALHLALIAANVGPGDEVICPSFTFIATANAIVHAGARPVFVDIDAATYNIAPELAEAAITPRTKAIMPVDQIGLAADIPAIREIARRHGLVVVEDAAPSLGAAIGESRIGSMSDYTCFSFHPRKSITTAEGGMICTADPAAAERLRVLRSHGASTSDLARHQSGELAFESYEETGFNYRLSDVHAAIGVAQMRRLEGIIEARRRLAAGYAVLLSDVPGLVTPKEPAGYRHTYQSYCVRLTSGADRPVVMRKLAEDGIATRRGVMAIHLETAFREIAAGVSLPVTEAATRETLLLPMFPSMTGDEQTYIAEKLEEALR